HQPLRVAAIACLELLQLRLEHLHLTRGLELSACQRDECAADQDCQDNNSQRECSRREDNMHYLIDKDQDVIDGLEKHIMEKLANGPKNLAQELTDALHALCPPLRRLWRRAALHSREGMPSAPGMTPRARSCDRHRDRTKVNISACRCEDSHHATP